MKSNQHAYFFVQIAILSTLSGISYLPLANASTLDEKDKKIQILEQRLLLLEKRLDAQTVLINPSKQSIEENNQEEAEDKIKTSPKLEINPKGVGSASSNGDNSVRLRASIQSDGRFFVNDNRNLKGVNEGFLTNRFELKQARIWLEGRFERYTDFKLMPDFGANGTNLADAYIDLHYFPFASLSVGKQKTPISLERLQGDSDGTFLERAYPTYLSSNRDIGVKLHGSFAAVGDTYAYASPIDFKNFLTYEVGIFNGGGDNGANDADKEHEDNKEVAGRLWLHPFKNKGIAVLNVLGIGIAGSWENPKKNATTVKALKSALGQNTLVDYTKVVPTVVAVQANGEHYRIYPQAYWYYGSYGLLGEYVLSSQKLTGDGGKTAIQQSNTAWQIQVSYVFTGEDSTFQGVKPRTSFDPLNGTWGALQIAGRWSELSIDKETFKLLDPQASIAGARSWTIGANWFLNQNVRLMADYEHTYFSGGAVSGNRPTEKAFASRLQLVF